MANPTPGTPTSATTPAPERKRSFGDAYTWMLILSLMFLTIGCVMLLLEWSQYWEAGNWFQVRPTK